MVGVGVGGDVDGGGGGWSSSSSSSSLRSLSSFLFSSFSQSYQDCVERPRAVTAKQNGKNLMPDEYIMDSPIVSVYIFFLLTARVGVVEIGSFARSVMLVTSTVHIV